MSSNYAVGVRDGTQKFGLTTGKASPNTSGGDFIVESYSESTGSDRVDIDDGNGKPIGSTVVPTRIEVSLTVQYGDNDADKAPTIGETLTYDGNTIGITGVEINETQGDYVRATLSGYKLTEGTSLVALTDIT
tara:strand:+ start:1867 stop:2265 length:399 start_codon:yes stop_codon:yes gene_type:complete